MVCVINRHWEIGLGSPQTPTTTPSIGLALVTGFGRMPLSLCLNHQKLEVSESVSIDDTACADQLFNCPCWWKIKSKVRDVKSQSLHWVRLYVSHRRTDTSSGHSFNLNNCKLLWLQHKSLTVPPLRDKERKEWEREKDADCFPIRFYSKKHLTSAGVIVCDWVFLLTCWDWLCFILDLDSSKEQSRPFYIFQVL